MLWPSFLSLCRIVSGFGGFPASGGLGGVFPAGWLRTDSIAVEEFALCAGVVGFLNGKRESPPFMMSVFQTVEDGQRSFDSDAGRGFGICEYAFQGLNCQAGEVFEFVQGIEEGEEAGLGAGFDEARDVVSPFVDGAAMDADGFGGGGQRSSLGQCGDGLDLIYGKMRISGKDLFHLRFQDMGAGSAARARGVCMALIWN